MATMSPHSVGHSSVAQPGGKLSKKKKKKKLNPQGFLIFFICKENYAYAILSRGGRVTKE